MVRNGMTSSATTFLCYLVKTPVCMVIKGRKGLQNSLQLVEVGKQRFAINIVLASVGPSSRSF